MRHIITYGADAVPLRTEAPESSGAADSPAITIATTGGTELLAATAATVYAGDTLASEAEQGRAAITLTTGTALAEGDVIRLTGDAFTQDIEVQAYDTATKTATLRGRLDHSFPASSTVTGRWLSYSLDASDTDVFTHLAKVVVTWLWNSDDPPHREYGDINKFDWDTGALLSRFRATFGRYEELLHDGQWADEVYAAYSRLRMMFLARSRDIDHLVDKLGVMDELLMLRIAVNIARGGGDDWEVEYLRLSADFKELFEDVCNSDLWTDDDEDGVEDDSESGPVTRPPHRRRLF